ncbi:MAG: LamG domain-containing protein [Candidatus Poribacteria bacterium]|nr:LamG domain-containing protein [Candidatus Poribacteria bacterium]
MKPIFWITIIGSLCMATFPLSADLLDDAVGIWLFDEGKGGIAADTSGNGNDGAISGAKWAEGKFGGALEFEPPHVVTVEPADSLNFKDQMSIATWVYMNKGVSDTAIRRNGSYLLEVQSAGERVPGGYVFGIWSGGGFTGGVWGTSVIEPEKWYHIVGLYNGNEMQLYVDGTLEAAVKQDGDVDHAGELLFGTFGGEKFIGRLDEVIFFDRGITEAEITELMKGVEAVLPVSPNGLLTTTWGQLKNR